MYQKVEMSYKSGPLPTYACILIANYIKSTLNVHFNDPDLSQIPILQ